MYELKIYFIKDDCGHDCGYGYSIQDVKDTIIKDKIDMMDWFDNEEEFNNVMAIENEHEFISEMGEHCIYIDEQVFEGITDKDLKKVS